MMYNSQCVLTHPPSGPEEAYGVSLSTQNCTAWWREAFRFVNLNPLSSIYKITKKYAHQKQGRQQILRCPFVHHSRCTRIHVHMHAPLLPHKTVAGAQINIKAWPWMSLAVTGTLWYEKDPIDPRPTRPSSSKGHHSISIDLLHACVCEKD